MAVTTRRSFLAAAVALGATAVVPRLVLGQDPATPEAAPPSLLAGLGLPELTVAVTADGLDFPAETTAGTTLLRGINQTEGYAGLAFVQLPEGVTEDDLMASLGPDTGIPDFAHESVMTGGVSLPPGAQGEVAFVLGPGAWYVLNIGEAFAIAPLTVTGDLTETPIAADVEVEMSHHDFAIPADITSGAKVWHVTNVDPVLHHMVLLTFPQPVTEDEVLQALMAQEGMGTPPAGLDIAAIGFTGECGLVSMGQSNWLEFDLAAGTHAAVCYIADPGSEVPHVAMGMIEVFTVS